MDAEKLYEKWKTLTLNLETESISSTYKPGKTTPILKTALMQEVDSILSNPTDSLLNSEEIVKDTLPASPIPEKSTSDFFPKSSAGYEMIQEIARGGMGIVFRGRQRSLNREVAIKKLQHKLSNAQDQEKFIVESKVTAFLDHPNIIPVYELGETPEKEIILIMKLIGGKSWKDVLKSDQEKETPLSQVNLEKHLRILWSVCNAVAFAHNKGIIHNDIKPENIMLGEFGEIFLMDWGISVSMDAQNKEFVHKSMITNPMGTPSYMAPELANGEGDDIGPWTDVYMLGAILYEILMQRPPHQGKTLIEVLYNICYTPIELSQEVTKELQKICLKALAKTPQERYQSVYEFQTEIENFLQHQESIFIAQEAQQILKECQPQNTQDELKTNPALLYEEFAQSIAGFRQALKLWNGNKEATQGEIDARIAYAHRALKKGDFGLAEAQLEKIKIAEEAIILQKEIEQAKELQSRKEIAQKIIQICTFVLLIGIFKIIVASITYFIFKEEEFIFLSNHPLQISLSCIFFLITSVFYFQITTQSYPTQILLRMAVLYENCGVFLLSLTLFILPLPMPIQATGLYLSALWILFFRFLIPYPKKIIWWSGITDVFTIILVIYLTSFAGNPLPEGNMVPIYVMQHIATAIIGGIVCAMRTNPQKNNFF